LVKFYKKFYKKMIKDRKKFEEFERELLKRERVDFVKNFYILEEMYKEAVELGSISC
jgi:hypothetical protein